MKTAGIAGLRRPPADCLAGTAGPRIRPRGRPAWPALRSTGDRARRRSPPWSWPAGAAQAGDRPVLAETQRGSARPSPKI